MARTVAEIEQSIIDAKNADTVLSVRLTSTSRVATWRLWAFIVAKVHRVLEVLFDTHKADVAAELAELKPHTVNWYKVKALAFQYGDALVPDEDYYPVANAANQVIKFAAAVEQSPRLRIKVATLAGGVLAQVPGAQLVAFTQYMNEIKDAGVRLACTSGNPDDLQAAYTIYYDPLVLGADGARLDGTAATPVLDAIRTFLQSLDFNGLFVINRLVDAVERVEGVRICRSDLHQARYGALDFVVFTTEYLPDAGYLLFDEAYFTDNTSYIPHNPI